MTIPVERTTHPRARPAEGDLGFGKHFTDHQFRADWAEGRGWHGARVVPYGPLLLDPAASAFHYGQAIFEGMKAFAAKGGVALFRPRAHAARLAASARRLEGPDAKAPLAAVDDQRRSRSPTGNQPTSPVSRNRIRPGSGTERFSTSSPSHTAERYARRATVSGGICR